MAKKKIGLITWFIGLNYGTNLQAYSLYKKIEDLGYDCYFITDFTPCPAKEGASFLKRCTRSCSLMAEKIFPKLVRKLLDSRLSGNKIRRKRTQHLINTMKQINEIRQEKVQQALVGFDVFVTGSDQLWNPDYVNPFYMLSFAENKKRVAYATSMGVSVLPKEKEEDYRQYLEKFDAIGVRENTAAQLLSVILPRQDIKVVLDPTFLLTATEWQKFGEDAQIDIKLSEPYIFCYFIGKRSEYKIFVDEVCQKKQIHNVIVLSSTNEFTLKINGTYCETAGPKEFIYYLNNAAFICTDSFHASALSINLSKNFVEFMRFDSNDVKSQNSRIYDLLNHYELQNRIYSKENDEWTKPIDYVQTNRILEQDRIFSFDFLKNALKQDSRS